MLLKCIECKHKVSEYAEMCPYCGCPIDKIKEGLQTDVVSVEKVKETVASTSFDVSKTICPVCKNECKSGAEVCLICGFNELHKEFISKEDGNLWLETVVIPYRTEWENSQVDLSDFEIEGTVLKRYNGNEEKVVIPSNVIRIDDGAFFRCGNLTEITIPSSVTSIGNRVFFCCENLTEITIPSSVIRIDDGAFIYCENLTEIIVNVDNEKYISENGILFSKDKTELIRFSEGKKEAKYKIPGSVISIYGGAFSWGRNLTEITIPDSVTSIGECSFYNCKNLKEITVPNSVISIGDSAFTRCNSLTEITIPNSVTSIGKDAFTFCSNLQKVYIPQKLKIGDEAFKYCHPDLEIIRY